MTIRKTTFTGTALVAFFAAIATANAAPVLRTQVDQHGDFLLIGNTFGYDCTGEPPIPKVGTIAAGACSQGAYVPDNSPDLFWQADSPAAGQATADISYGPSVARTTAQLIVPTGATVTHAYLYWGGKTNSSSGGMAQVTVERIGTDAFQQAVSAVNTYTAGFTNAYESVADITSLVQQHKSGAYRVSGIAVSPFANVDDNTVFGAWAMVVLYKRASEPLRNLAVFDGMDVVNSSANQSVSLSGFVVPTVGFEGKLGIITYEGDADIAGDQVFFNGGTPLQDNVNPPDNFFNATRSWMGSPVSVDGDLPQLTGGSRSMSGVDLDVVDITSRLEPGKNSATVLATSTGDEYYLGAFVTSIANFKPDFTTSTKTVTDLNGGSILAGDILEYTLTAKNTGNDASVRTVIRDPLPLGVSYVPGTLNIVSGANAGVKTDAIGDDQAEYNSNTRAIVAWLGASAAANVGGIIPINGSSAISFRVKIDEGFSGKIANQGTVTAGGQLGTTDVQTVTDGNGDVDGTPPTEITADECDTNAQCGGAKPACDTSVSPRICITCMVDRDCGSSSSGKLCLASHTCTDGCRGSGGNGCPDDQVCTSLDATAGSCVGCNTDEDCGSKTSGRVCVEATHTCEDGCRGKGGNGCPKTDTCSSNNTSIGDCLRTGSENNGGAGGLGGAGGQGGTDDGGTTSTSRIVDVVAQGNGCACSVPSSRLNSGVVWVVGFGLAMVRLSRRRRRSL